MRPLLRLHFQHLKQSHLLTSKRSNTESVLYPNCGRKWAKVSITTRDQPTSRPVEHWQPNGLVNFETRAAGCTATEKRLDITLH